MKLIHKRTAGFSLLEVLIALVILSVGLLGLAAMQAEGLRGSSNAQLRHQASRLVSDIVDRMRANPAGVTATTVDGNYEIAAAETAANPESCADDTDAGVTAKSCSPSEMAGYDKFLWRQHVTDLLPTGTSSIVRAADSRFLISVGWTDRGTDLNVSTEVHFYDFQ
jgi:type IV pilus assembly protein PilV